MTLMRTIVWAFAFASAWGCAPDTAPLGPGRYDGGLHSRADAGCGENETSCGGTCIDLANDFRNCGMCGRSCNAGEVCHASSCLAGGCPDSTTDCGGSCIDTSSSPLHCGGCNISCPANAACNAGTCVCSGSLMRCGDACVDPRIDAAHCGSCDNACGVGESCQAGACRECGAGVSFAAHVQPIFTRSCVGNACHGGMRPSSGLSLEAGRAYAELVNVASTCTDRRLLVAPRQPENSHLYQKIADVNICSGRRMPLSSGPLPANEITTIREWICGGARND